MRNVLLIIILLTPSAYAAAEAGVVNELLQQYTRQGAGQADESQGQQLWKQSNNNNGQRSCSSCHTEDLTHHGKHIKTGKLIKPMSPSVNPERLSDTGKVNKWFKRNCKWTLGRECTPQEKANFLVYINNSPRKLF